MGLGPEEKEAWLRGYVDLRDKHFAIYGMFFTVTFQRILKKMLIILVVWNCIVSAGCTKSFVVKNVHCKINVLFSI